MKVSFLYDGVYSYASGVPSAVGGAERDQWLLGAALARFGWSVTVGVRNGLEPGQRKIINGVEFVGLSRGQILLAWFNFLSAERPDWWYWECATHLWGPAVEIAKYFDVRTIFATGLDRDVEPRRALFRRRWLWPVYAWGLSRTDRIFVQHHGQLSALPAHLRSKAHVFPKICILPGVIGDRKAKPHAERSKYVAWVAMLRQPKRPDRLVNIARRMPDTRFVVCGGPTTFMTPPGYSEEIIKNFGTLPNVEFLGQVAPEKAHEIIADAAVLLSTSDEEGFPNTFTQAWSSGTPVVTLKLDPDNIIQTVGLGTVSGTLDQTIADIATLITSVPRREEIAARARRFVLQNYSAAAVVKLFENVL
jgi:glycosyltransferase involved in cell wall biosynthesis